MKNYAGQQRIVEKSLKLYTQIVDGYKEEKKTQNEGIDKFWDIYNCVLNDEQQYEGDDVDSLETLMLKKQLIETQAALLGYQHKELLALIEKAQNEDKEPKE